MNVFMYLFVIFSVFSFSLQHELPKGPVLSRTRHAFVAELRKVEMDIQLFGSIQCSLVI